MKHHQFSVFLLIAVICGCVLFLIPGCSGGGGAKVTVKGKLVLPKTIGKIQKNDNIEIAFLPSKSATTGGDSIVASTNTLTFESKGKLTPGIYKIIVTIQPYIGEGTEARRQLLAQFSDAYSSDNSQLKYEVTSAEQQSITLDLVNGIVEKK